MLSWENLVIPNGPKSVLKTTSLLPHPNLGTLAVNLQDIVRSQIPEGMFGLSHHHCSQTVNLQDIVRSQIPKGM